MIYKFPGWNNKDRGSFFFQKGKRFCEVCNEEVGSVRLVDVCGGEKQDKNHSCGKPISPHVSQFTLYFSFIAVLK